MGWPAALQELVPTVLYDEEDAYPLDWIDIDNRQVSSMELKSKLDQNIVRQMMEQAERGEKGAGGIKWKKVLPFILLGLGIVGLVAIFIFRSQAGVPA